MRREFFPEVDAGSFEIAVREPTGTRIEVTEKMGREGRGFHRKPIPEDDLQPSILSEIGVTPDWSAAYTQNSGPMDAVIKVQLEQEQRATPRGVHAVSRADVKPGPAIQHDLEVAFDAGGMVRAALNEGKSTRINIASPARTRGSPLRSP